MLKKENGVTLVALIITIIVLLILAGISFTMVLGDNGLLTRAQDAGNAWANGEANEANYLNDAVDKYDEMYDKYVNHN